jgi:hypothetical protein
MDARIERRIRPAGRVGRQRAGDQRRFEQQLSLEQAGERVGGRELRAVQQCQPLLGAEAERLQARLGQRLGGRPPALACEDLADADHRRRHVGERREVARGADRALTGHDRRQILGQHRFEEPNCLESHARCALRQAAQLQCHHQPRDGDRHRLADTRGMRQHDVALEHREIGSGNADAGELSEAGVDAVDRLSLGQDRRHRGGGALDGAVGRRIEADRNAAVNLPPRGQRDLARYQRYAARHVPSIVCRSKE